MHPSMRADRWGVAWPALVFVAALALYTWTLHGDVQPADSGELQIAALLLGIPHPPGYPLFTLLGWLFAHLPLPLSLFGRVSWLSAVSAALTLTVAARAVWEVSPTRLAALAGGVAALAIGVSTTFWAQATTTNIRSLTALFAVLMLWVSTRTWHSPDPARLREFALVTGLGVAHHGSLVFIAGVLGVWVVARLWRQGELSAGVVLSATLILVATQAVWLYLPLRDAAGARFAPGTLRTLQGLLFHVLARGFGGDMLAFAAPDVLGQRLALSPVLLRFQFSLPVLLGLVAGWAMLIVRQRALGLVWLIAWVLHGFISLTYRAPQTVEYALPCWVLLGVAGGAGAATALTGSQTRRAALIAVSLLLLLAIRDGWERSMSYRWLAADRTARIRAEQTLRAAPSGAVIFAQWHQATPLWALQDVEGLRLDVRVEYVFPQGAQPYAVTFAQRLAEQRARRPTCATSFFEAEFVAQRLDLRPVAGAPLWCTTSGMELPPPDAVTFENGLRAWLVLPSTQAQVGELLWLDVHWEAADPHAQLSLTARFLRPDGRLAGQADVRLEGRARGARRAALGVPLDVPPGAYALWLGAYPSDAPGQPLRLRGRDAVFAAVAQLQIVPAEMPPATRRRLVTWPAAEQPQLLGVDYDTGVAGQLRLWTHWQLGTKPQVITVTDALNMPLASPKLLPARQAGSGAFLSLAFDVPLGRALRLQPTGHDLPSPRADERYLPLAGGLTLVGAKPVAWAGASWLTLHWLAARPLVDDYVVSARVLGENVYRAHDSVPALGAIPTLKWIRGSVVDDLHPFSADVSQQVSQGEVVVYDSVNRLALPLLDERYEGRLVLPIGRGAAP